MKSTKKSQLAQKRRWRIRKKIRGTAERPRLAVHFSNKHIYAQAINDDAGTTLVYHSTVSKGKTPSELKANTTGAAEVAKTFAEKAKAAGIEAVVFDRAGRRYHGCVKVFAEAAREGGLQF